MKFENIQFENEHSQRVYVNYIKSIENVITPLSEKDRQEILMEFNSHIYEDLQNNKSKSELEALLNTIDRLGVPEEVLRPLVADKILEKATRTFNPKDVFNALFLNLSNGISYVIFSLLYLFLGSFVFLIIAKLFNNNVGMYYKDGAFQAIGLVNNNEGYQEVLGHWFIPLMLLSIVVFYFLITILLKIIKSINNKKQL
jgi:hypothetical protein